MGRKKIAIKKISDGRRRQVTFVRRKYGLMKKAYELSVLCDCDVALMMITSDQKLHLYSNKSMQEMVLKYNDITTDSTNCEIIDDDGMVKLIERGKEGLEDYFGGGGGSGSFGNDDFEDEDEDDQSQQQAQQKDELYTEKRRGGIRKRNNSSGGSSSKKSKSGRNGGNSEEPGSPLTSQLKIPLTNADDQPPQPHQIITPHYYYAAAPPGFGGTSATGHHGHGPHGHHQHHPHSFIPYQPYVLYPHPSAFHPGVHETGHEDGSGVGGGSGKTQPSTGNNSALHLPPLPFAFAQPDGAGSSQSLSHGDHGQMPSLPASGSTMFAGGMYYPFGAPWPIPGLHGSGGSTGELRNATNSTMDLIAAATSVDSSSSTTAAGADDNLQEQKKKSEDQQLDEGGDETKTTSTSQKQKKNNNNNNTNSSNMESVNVKEENLKEEEEKSKKAMNSSKDTSSSLSGPMMITPSDVTSA